MSGDDRTFDPGAVARLREMIGSEKVAMPEAAASAAPVEATPMAPVAEDSEPSVAAVSSEATGTRQVYGVQFDAQETGDRVVILSDAMLDYQLAEPDPGTLVVRIQGATIDAEAAVRIAPEKPGPVSLVTAFAQPEADQPEVRVVISRAAGLEPQVEQQGTMLFLDFPRGSEIAGELPMMVDLDSALASQGELGQADATPSKASAKALGQAEAELMAEVPAAIDGSGGSVVILKEGGLVDGKQYSGRRISLDFKDVEIDDVLRLIAEVSDLNIIAGDEVSGQVTIRLVDVPWDQALSLIHISEPTRPPLLSRMPSSA